MVLPVDRLTPYLRVRIATDDRSLAIERRRAPLGLIPLSTQRIEIPLIELASARVKRNVRLQCLVAALVLAAGVFLLDLPMVARVALGIAAVLELLLALGPGEAMRVERTDGRSWTIPFCRTHTFDASLAMEDAQQRRNDLERSRSSRLPM
jgi:hypothetical protein